MGFRTPLLPLLLAAACAAAPALAQAPAQTKRPMTFADLQAMRRVGDPQISPSGKWVLFSVTDVSLAGNSKTNHLWLVPLDGSTKEHQLTTGSGESNGRFSPDGQWIMYTADANGKGEIFIAPWNDAAGSIDAAHAVTALETEAAGAIWAPDSKHFLFVSDVYPECESHALMGPQRNQEEAACNAEKDAAADASPVKALIFTHLLYRHWDHFLGNKRSHIFYSSIDPVDGAPANPTDLTPASVIGDRVAPTFSLGGPLGYAISPDGKQVAYVANLEGLHTDPNAPAETTNNDIYVVSPTADPTTARKVSTSPGSDDGPQYSPDGKWLAWRSQARNGYESDKFDLVVMNRASGHIKDLTSDFDGWINEFSWLPSMSAIVFVSDRRGEAPIYLLPFQPDAPKQVFREREDVGYFSGVQMLSDGALVATRMGVNHPAEIFASKPLIREKDGNFGGGESFMLTHLNDALVSTLQLDQAENFWFPGANGTKVEGFLVKPPNFDPAKKYPLKFLIHGGPQGAWGDEWSYRWNPELFAADGYVVVMINPRGSNGYGQQFLEELSGDWGGRPYIDLMKGLDYAEQHYPFIDKNRECALGASYGGYMADWVLTHTDRFKCIVTHDGMSDPTAAFGTTEELWFPEWEFRTLASNAPDAVVEQNHPSHPWDFYGKPEMDDPYIKWSPMRFIKNARTPTLVVHSQNDYRLDLSQGLELFTALQLLHVPSKMLYFPNESHWVQKPQDSELWYKTVDDWCDQWVGANKYAATGPANNPLAQPEKQ